MPGIDGYFILKRTQVCIGILIVYNGIKITIDTLVIAERDMYIEAGLFQTTPYSGNLLVYWVLKFNPFNFIKKIIMTIIIKEIDFGSAEYRQEIALRYRILREPLGLTYSDEQLAAEAAETRLGCFVDEVLCGCLLLKPVDANTMQFRQAAVAADKQGMGLGRQLMLAGEKIAAQKGFTSILLHARQHVIPFYEKLGYHCVGDPYTEVGIPHCTMVKPLSE